MISEIDNLMIFTIHLVSTEPLEFTILAENGPPSCCKTGSILIDHFKPLLEIFILSVSRISDPCLKKETLPPLRFASSSRNNRDPSGMVVFRNRRKISGFFPVSERLIIEPDFARTFCTKWEFGQFFSILRNELSGTLYKD